MTASRYWVKLRRELFSASIQLFSCMKRFLPNQRALESRCEQIPDISYTPDIGEAGRLDIYRPKQRREPLPVLMYIHGGGFTMCSKDTHRGIGLIYASQGYLVVNINYRLAPKHRFPAALEDTAAAYRWIVKNAREYGGDTNRIIVGGESAGGNLTLALAVSACFRRPEPAAKIIWNTGAVPKIVMPFCGFLQVSDPYRLQTAASFADPLAARFARNIARDVARAYLGRQYKAPRPATALADPLLIMESEAQPERTPPVFYAMAGDRDIVLDDTRRLETALNQRDIRNAVRYYPNEGHVFHLIGASPHASEHWKDHLSFLNNELRRAAESE